MSRADDSLRLTIGRLIRALGDPPKPSKIVQPSFDYVPAENFRRLFKRGRKPPSVDLHDFASALSYLDEGQIQLDLFLYVLPVCLAAWREGVLDHESDYGDFRDRFAVALVGRQGLRHLLGDAQYAAVSSFVREVVIERIDDERAPCVFCRASSWMGEVATFAMAVPFIDALWREWWSATTAGRASGILEFVSLLLYPSEENPIFSPSVGCTGHEPPEPWESSSCYLWDRPWRAENVEFLLSVLDVEFVRDSMEKAAARLRGTTDSSIPSRMLEDLERRRSFIERRIVDLLENLSLPQGETRAWRTG